MAADVPTGVKGISWDIRTGIRFAYNNRHNRSALLTSGTHGTQGRAASSSADWRLLAAACRRLPMPRPGSVPISWPQVGLPAAMCGVRGIAYTRTHARLIGMAAGSCNFMRPLVRARGCSSPPYPRRSAHHPARTPACMHACMHAHTHARTHAHCILLAEARSPAAAGRQLPCTLPAPSLAASLAATRKVRPGASRPSPGRGVEGEGRLLRVLRAASGSLFWPRALRPREKMRAPLHSDPLEHISVE